VGGATRTPLVTELLEQRLGRRPRADVHPDLCVALGAGVMASRLGGHQVDRVLVDVSPYSFGPSYLGTYRGEDYLHCYRPIIHRNTPLPVTRTSSYYTAAPFQTVAAISIYQGEDEDALRNILVGEFRIEGLRPMEEPNEILVRMNLDLDGILQVSATEKATGRSREITITGALRPMSEADLAAARERLAELLEAEGGLDAAFAAGEGDDEAPTVAVFGGETDAGAGAGADDGDDRSGTNEDQTREARELVARSRGLLGQMHAEDQQEVIDLNESIENALDVGDLVMLRESVHELKEILFFIEGQ
jgi:molecular chaperone DnaK (HSP70)